MTAGVVEGRRFGRDLDLDCDVVVVGSGGGGAVVATELAAAGWSVVVLEEGSNLSAQRLGKMRQSESLRHVWREGGMTAALGIGGAPTVNVTMGRGIGGSSVVTGGVCFRTPGHVLAEWRNGLGLRELTEAAVDPEYSHVEKAIHVEEVPISMRSRSTTLFAEGSAKLGAPLTPTRRNTQGCDGCGRCNFGCPHQAKLSVDLSYLPRAIASGARVYSDCLVETVTMKGERAIGVTGHVMDEHGTRRHKLSVRAKKVVVAAGGVHTPVLLAASGFSMRKTQVGKNLTLHPGFRVYARFDESVRGWSGAMQSAYTDAHVKDHVTLMSLFVPASVIAATMPGSGPRHSALAEKVPNIAMFGALIHDEGGGVILRNPIGREPFMLYRATKRDHKAMRRGIELLSKTFLAAGAKEIFIPVLGQEGLSASEAARYDYGSIPIGRLECASQHPLGSCRMAVSEKMGVVDVEGRVFGTKGLYVADGSIVPSSIGVNPQLTVMAMATRVAWKMRDRGLAAS